MDVVGPTYAFELAGGRSMYLRSLDQWWTYHDLLVGAPSRSLNRRIMDRLVARYTRQDGGHEPVLLEPLQTPSGPSASPFESDDRVTLPGAVCVARFWSEKLPEDALGVASILRVIWFQDDFAFPIDPGIMVELGALDWEARAASWSP